LVVVANDFQIPFHDEKALLLFKMFLRRERPDWLILNGDFQDFWEISSYDLTPRSGKDFKREIEIGRGILRSFRRSLPNARITWIEGNHEFRLRKYLIQRHTHRFGAHARTTVDGRVLLGIENFSMCARRQSYVSRPNWQLGFSVVYFQPNTGRFQWFPILIAGDYRFLWRNREYSLDRIRRLSRSS
jgi:hypothetical protein